MTKNQPNRRAFKARLVGGGLAAATFAAMLGVMPVQSAEQAFIWNGEDENLEWGPCPEFMPEGCGIAVLQGDPAEPPVDIFFRLPGNATAERHWHNSSERIVLVSGEMEVDYDGQEPVILQPGTYAYGPPELPHTAVCLSSEPCVLFIAFEKPLDAMAGAPE
ncbi:cupin domain-containing protein [Chelativorans sp. YIM 93263]|uniref:cupin domain-containing protein n=1 Tax=Chelativorans sp. YIM 93263 TaxID=2906648 RepID=UPI002378A2EC|nr:cupin domain-containing protein [Chelativorans sp. YIM 93263]